MCHPQHWYSPGDEVIIPEPCFVCYEPITTLSGGVPVHVALTVRRTSSASRADALKAAITPQHQAPGACPSPTTPPAR